MTSRTVASNVLSGLTAMAAVVTTAEIYSEHYKASFGNKWMWSPIVVTPPVVVAGIGGVFSRRWAKRWLPITAGIYTANGLMGEYLHARGVARKPGGWKNASYNVPMGPPIAAPGLMCMVGGMGLLASVLRRETFRDSTQWPTPHVPITCLTCARTALRRIRPGFRGSAVAPRRR